ncbi:MAG: HIT domain-containing protein [Deltaproteobacteria bacterium]|nr:HIT domain-containing protein [Deltaproteobacteria bacterium]
MKILWAPWRMEYVLSGDEGDGCIFCPGDNRENDEERLILYVGSKSVILMNKYPYNNAHLLVAPKRHLPGLDQLSPEESLDLLLKVRSSIDILKRLMSPEGFNVGLNLGRVAGAGVAEHMHFHIVPRWSGDTNYMTVFSDVRVIPEHIRETYGKLKSHFMEISDS